MGSYEHKKLIERILEVDKLPDDQSAYSEWIKADAHLQMLRTNGEEDEVIVYASGDYTFIHTVVVSEREVFPLDQDDLLRWSGDPSSLFAGYAWGGDRDDVWIDRSGSIHGAETLRSARQLVFERSIEGLQGKNRLYYEVLQEYAHIVGIHWRTEHGAYCRFDPRGELEHVVSTTSKETRSSVSLVSFKRQPLEECLAASDSILITMFDFTLLRNTFAHGPMVPKTSSRKITCFFDRRSILGRQRILVVYVLTN